MTEEEPTSAELSALANSRRRVIESFKTPAIDFEPPLVRAGEGLWQRGNIIGADRRNPNLSENPIGGGGTPDGVELREVTVLAQGSEAIMRVLGEEPEPI